MAEGSPDGGAGGRASVTSPAAGTGCGVRPREMLRHSPLLPLVSGLSPLPAVRPERGAWATREQTRPHHSAADEAASLCRGPCGLQPQPVLNPAKPRMPNAPRKE